MKGYPVGSACIITHSLKPFRIGRVVTIVTEPFVHVPGKRMPDGGVLNGGQYYAGKVCQSVDGLDPLPTWGVGPNDLAFAVYPVEWMRPYSDPDAVKETEGELIHE